MYLRTNFLARFKATFYDSPDLPIGILVRAFKVSSKSLLHCGAGFVEEANLYRSLGFNKVIWIEALPQIFEESRRRLLDFPEQNIVQAALWDSSQVMKMNIASNVGSSSLLRCNRHSEVFPEILFNEIQRVQTRTLDSLDLPLEDNFFMVLDLQGSELMALRGASQTLQSCSFLYVEASKIELYAGSPTIQEIVDFLSPKFELIDWRISNKYGYGNLFFARKGLVASRRLQRVYRLYLSFLYSLSPKSG